MTFLHVDLVQTLQHSIFRLFLAILHYDLYDNTLNHCPLTNHSSELFQSTYFTSGFETASLLSSNPQTAFLSGDLFSQVEIPTPVPAHIRLPEYYTAEHSRPPTPNFADYPLRVDGITIYDPQNDPRFPILAERFINNNDLLSHKRKETELKRLQTSILELKFEVKVKFQGLNPHPIFHVSKIEHKISRIKSTPNISRF